ncbi:MAG: GspE/PulE family protein [Aquabacterium sp.]|nr:GspE/PulE family protein [Aquabacterium sp.]
MARPERIRLGDLLVREQLVTADQVQQALGEQQRSGRKLGRIFIDSGWVTEAQIAQALARQLRVAYAELDPRQVRPEVARLLPEVQARRLRALPLEDLGATLRVAMADPTDLAAYDELARILKREVELVVAPESQLLAALDQSYRHREQIAGLAQELKTELTSVEDEFGDLLGLSTATAEDAPVVRLLYSVFEEALRVRASDIHIEPQERTLRIRFRIDGMLQVQTEADPKIAGAVALRLKLMSGLDISEKRLPQDGRFNVRLRASTVDVRISTMPTQHGESVVMRLLAQTSGLLALERLNLPERVERALRRAIARPSGMVLVTGPTGSGKTTSLYAALNALNTTERKIITVEDPVEYRLPGLNQVQVMEKIDLGFERVLRAALRQDPDIVLVGEMRDQVTAEIGMRAAITGHLVLSTLHTNSAPESITRLLEIGLDPFMFSDSLLAILAQRLVRRLCTKCRQAETLAPHALRDLAQLYIESSAGRGETMDALVERWQRQHGDGQGHVVVYRRQGCTQCDHSGYQGRMGVHELMVANEAARELIRHRAPAAELQAAALATGMVTLRQDGIEKVLAGLTDLPEVLAATNQ